MSGARATDLVPVIGLEVHCQLATRTKLFCACPNAFGAPPNAHTCPICTGQPGALPMPGEAALRLALRAALALGCDVDRASRFDRKNYFYPDLPKGFQTTQYARPLGRGGVVEMPSGGRCRLTRIHVEEDAGKAIHDAGDRTLVDLNRAGVPLIEIVTEPDLASADEARELLTSLREIVRYAGVSDGDMDKGSLRCDVNVSLHAPGAPLGTKVELKNLNSIRHVGEAIEHEVERQSALLARGERVAQETRLFDAASGTTRTMRTKEDEDDYRYFPEPDLPPAVVTDAMLAEERAAIPELPAARRARYVGKLGLSEYDAGVLTADRAVADFFEAAAELSGTPKAAANWIANDVLAAVGDDELPGSSIEELRVTPRALAELIELVEAGTVHASGARRSLRAMLETGRGARAVVAELGLEQVTDEGRIEAWCRDALAANERAAAEVAAGNAKALGALIGPVMKASDGKANPAQVRAALRRLIEGGDGAARST